jgi:hypothetical protein
MTETEWRIEIIKRDLRIRELESAALQKLLGELEAEVSATPIPKPKKVKK